MPETQNYFFRVCRYIIEQWRNKCWAGDNMKTVLYRESLLCLHSISAIIIYKISDCSTIYYIILLY